MSKVIACIISLHVASNTSQALQLHNQIVPTLRLDNLSISFKLSLIERPPQKCLYIVRFKSHL